MRYGRNFLMSMWYALSVMCLLVVGAPALEALTAEEQALFENANQSYRLNNYGEAIEDYERLSNNYPESPEIYFNLGNAYYRNQQMGEAILAYERAKLYDPRNEDIEHNLQYVKSLIEYRVDDGRNWYVRYGESLLKSFTENEIFLAVFVIYFIFAASWAFMLFYKRGVSWGWKRKILLGLLICFAVLLVSKGIEKRVMRDAIVMENEVEVRYGPSDTDQIAFRMGEGIKVYVIEHRDEWSRIVLVNDKRGWVRNNYIREVIR